MLTGRIINLLVGYQLAIAPALVQWQWKVEALKDFSSKAILFADCRAAIVFFSCRVVPPIALFQHLDQYSDKHYKATVLDRTITIAHWA